jgi:hypothetical protein
VTGTPSFLVNGSRPTRRGAGAGDKRATKNLLAGVLVGDLYDFESDSSAALDHPPRGTASDFAHTIRPVKADRMNISSRCEQGPPSVRSYERRAAATGSRQTPTAESTASGSTSLRRPNASSRATLATSWCEARPAASTKTGYTEDVRQYKPWRNCEAWVCTAGVCGLGGFELALILPGLMWLHRRRRWLH